MRKKIGIIGTVGLPAMYGGFETLAEQITKNQNKNFDFWVYCSTKAYPAKIKSHNKATLKYIPLKANGLQSIPYDIISIFHALLFVDILLVLGVSGGLIFPFVKFISNKKIIVNIDGIEWKRNKWGFLARQFLRFSEKIAVKYADVIIADNKVIQDRIKKSYGKDSELISYGADHSKSVLINNKSRLEYDFLKGYYAFKVCRIEPENNIEMILKAFTTYKSLNLVLVGNWNVSSYAQELRKKYETVANIYLLDPIYDQNDLDLIRSNCYIYVHGHSAGGTNPSLVEAMYLRLPILAFGVNYNRETTGNKALYFEDENSLVQLLIDLSQERLLEVAIAMQAIAEERHTWKIVAESYANIFSPTLVPLKVGA